MSEVLIDGVRYIPQRIPSREGKPLFELIIEARANSGETLEEVARQIGTTKSHVWTLENGDSVPRLPLLQRILRHFQIDFDEIEQGEGDGRG